MAAITTQFGSQYIAQASPTNFRPKSTCAAGNRRMQDAIRGHLGQRMDDNSGTRLAHRAYVFRAAIIPAGGTPHIQMREELCDSPPPLDPNAKIVGRWAVAHGGGGGAALSRKSGVALVGHRLGRKNSCSLWGCRPMLSRIGPTLNLQLGGREAMHARSSEFISANTVAEFGAVARSRYGWSSASSRRSPDDVSRLKRPSFPAARRRFACFASPAVQAAVMESKVVETHV